MDQETLLMLGEASNAGTYHALTTFCHLITRLNDLLSTKKPNEEKQYKTLRAYAIKLESFAQHKWRSEIQKKYRAGSAADVNNRRYHNVCYLITLVRQTVVMDSADFIGGRLEGRLDWAVTTFDLETMKVQIKTNFMPQPEFQLSKIGMEFHIAIKGERKPLEKLFPESFSQDEANPYTTSGSAKTPSPSNLDTDSLGLLDHCPFF